MAFEEDHRLISGNIVDPLRAEIYPGTLEIRGRKIANIIRENKRYDTFIIPGFIDAHIHIESSMLVPSEFARLAVMHGTVATLSDPHEIANVMGIDGVEYMIENGGTVPFKFYFGAPSCVPASPFESSGASLNSKVIDTLLARDEIKYLSEVMNFPGVLKDDPEIMAKIDIAKKYEKPIDGHAPGLGGRSLEKYIGAGILTDHETVDYDEGLEKLSLGTKLLIREGSAAKNLETLYPLIIRYPDQCMFCSDDKHPDDLLRGHIKEMAKRALMMGLDIMNVLKCTCVNAVKHYGLDVGLLQKGDHADFLVVDNLKELNILKAYINGQIVAERGNTLLVHAPVRILNNFRAQEKDISDFEVQKRGERINVIEAINGQILTGHILAVPTTLNGKVVADIRRDILKIVIVNRYTNTVPAIGFVKNFGLQRGAIASSVAHDSHNIVAVGTTDDDICTAVNLLIARRGGLSVVSSHFQEVLPLPIAGIMSNQDGFSVAKQYVTLDTLAKKILGTRLTAPFMTLSFMALSVIPKLKITDQGLLDVENVKLIDVFENR
ncbi:MAG: adenine deaminase [Dissulfurispiraceae bacterium]